MAMIPRPQLRTPNDYDTVKTAVTSIVDYVKLLEERITALEARSVALEEAYMEEKLLGKSEESVDT